MRRAGIILVIAVTALVVATGCAQRKTDKKKTETETESTETWESEPAAGILYTTPSHGGSYITWLDDDMKEAGESAYDFSAAYYDGYRNMCAQDGKVYLFPRGDYDRKDASQLEIVNLSDGSGESIDCGRRNVTGYAVSGNKIGYSSNENNACYLDIMDMGTHDRSSMTAEGATVFDVVLVDDILYGMSLDDQLQVRLMAFDPARKKQEILAELPDEDTPGFLQVHDGKILFITDGQLGAYDIKTEQLEKTELTRPDAYNLNLKGDTLWIAYTDVFSDGEQESLIEARDLISGKIVAQGSVPGAVLQMEISGNQVWLLGRDTLRRYLWSEEELTLEKELTPGRQGCDIGGLFVAEHLYGQLSEEEAIELNEELVKEADRLEVEPDKQ